MRVELPPEPTHFVNRDEERERAFRAVEEWRGRSRPLVLSLSGPEARFRLRGAADGEHTATGSMGERPDGW
ncbi:hypothetical protein [Streptomyces sp. NBC_01217]|uniref:hypothetical protein n=1 Tax=Streptomyces sp. NBC_01217 TaxID=2903779 RepID=UPI002E0E7AE1|nr:hypothetical protein OG507_38550 [Streptomyces sp. NBC_01217]